jgi:hypothetical protein
VSATNNDSWNTVTHVVLQTAEVAEVKLTLPVVRVEFAGAGGDLVGDYLLLSVFTALSTSCLFDNGVRSTAAIAHCCLNLNN